MYQRVINLEINQIKSILEDRGKTRCISLLRLNGFSHTNTIAGFWGVGTEQISF